MRGRGDRAVTGEHLARVGGFLQPIRDVHGVAGHERAALACRAHDDLARVDADAHLELAAEELVHSLLHRERRMQRTLGVILEGRGRAEDGHHRIADELLDRAAGELDLLAHRVVVPLELYPHALRVSISCVCGRPDEVGEENRDELALFTRVHEAEFRR